MIHGMEIEGKNGIFQPYMWTWNLMVYEIANILYIEDKPFEYLKSIAIIYM